jgi:hypothetical protein
MEELCSFPLSKSNRVPHASETAQAIDIIKSGGEDEIAFAAQCAARSLPARTHYHSFERAVIELSEPSTAPIPPLKKPPFGGFFNGGAEVTGVTIHISLAH